MLAPGLLQLRVAFESTATKKRCVSNAEFVSKKELNLSFAIVIQNSSFCDLIIL